MGVIPIDKIVHLFAGYSIAVTFALIFSPRWGYVAGISAGIIKEAYDEYKYGGGDFFDAFVTIAGATAGAMLVDITTQ